MATIRAYTTIEQSRKLAEILPLESADMYWFRDNVEVPCVYPKDMMKDSISVTCPCWSIAALLNILPNGLDATTTLSKGDLDMDLMKYRNDWVCEFEPELGSKYHTTSADNPVDACVDMIEHLHELKML